jgi:hypothetical protein
MRLIGHVISHRICSVDAAVKDEAVAVSSGWWITSKVQQP